MHYKKEFCRVLTNNYSGCKRYWPSKVVLAVVCIYGNSSRDPLICSFFKEEIRLASPISKETREGITPNSDLDWTKENAQTVGDAATILAAIAMQNSSYFDVTKV